MNWDFVCFSETRYLSHDIILNGGHRLAAHLSEKSSSGVAILIHARHKKKILQILSISDRVIGMDIKIGAKILRIISTYMPHAGYSYDEFLHCFDELVSLVTEAQDQRKYIIIGGDFNLSLKVGARGEVLEEFCNEFNLKVAIQDGTDDDDNN